ncbi:MAG: hypothetical protein BGO29_14945 [Bacteroidales bacterium 36-12]|nr:MAG: hypothetical protein BGO29_14945 [Bacteroidales bacterium 36-12]
MSQENTAVQQTVLLQVNQLQQIVATAPEILSQNIESKTKAIDAGNKIIELAKSGMNDVYDAQLATYITKAKKTIDAMNERRKPFTQIVDAVKKQFTTLEAELKPTIDEAQKLRDDCTTEKMKAKQEEERQSRVKLEKDKELIEIRGYCEVLAANYFSNCIDTTKNSIIKYFNELTLENIDAADKSLETASTKFESRYDLPVIDLPSDTIKPGVMYIDFEIKHASDEEVVEIINSVLNADFTGKKDHYSREIAATLKEYRDKLPSKKAELEAIAKAGEEEKARLEEAAKKRQQEEAERLAREKSEREAKAREEAAIAASAATAGAMVDASISATETPNVKEKYQIKLKNNAGYLLLVQFWFEKEGKAMPVDKFEKFTFDRIKRFCESYALKNEEFIESPLISYEPVYKAK